MPNALSFQVCDLYLAFALLIITHMPPSSQQQIEMSLLPGPGFASAALPGLC